jgi:hypothetical protein
MKLVCLFIFLFASQSENVQMSGFKCCNTRRLQTSITTAVPCTDKIQTNYVFMTPSFEGYMH